MRRRQRVADAGASGRGNAFLRRYSSATVKNDYSPVFLLMMMMMSRDVRLRRGQVHVGHFSSEHRSSPDNTKRGKC